MHLLQLTGLFAMFGALLYAIGDVLLLAVKINMDDYPRLKPFQKLLSDSEKMVALSSEKMMWGALIGVFATPLILAGFWQVNQGLDGANETLRVTTVILFVIGSVIGAFVHGTFFYLGEYVRALNTVNDESQPVIAEMIARHFKVLKISYAPVLVLIMIASILFSIMATTGRTHFPTWMAVVNPLTLTIFWMLLKRVLPQFVRDATEGAGFNIAFFAFFLCTTLTLWNGI